MAAVQGYGCISSVYILFQVLLHIAFRRTPASMLGFLVVLVCSSVLEFTPDVQSRRVMTHFFQIDDECAFVILTIKTRSSTCSQ